MLRISHQTPFSPDGIIVKILERAAWSFYPASLVNLSSPCTILLFLSLSVFFTVRCICTQNALLKTSAMSHSARYLLYIFTISRHCLLGIWINLNLPAICVDVLHVLVSGMPQKRKYNVFFHRTSAVWQRCMTLILSPCTKFSIVLPIPPLFILIKISEWSPHKLDSSSKNWNPPFSPTFPAIKFNRLSKACLLS